MRVQTARSQRGAGLVELIVVAPVLLLIVFGVIEFGRIYDEKLDLNQAVRDGARAATLGEYGEWSGCGDGDVTCVVAASIDDVRTAVTVGVSSTGLTVGDDSVTVCASTQLVSDTPLISSFVDGRTMTSEVTMRIAREDIPTPSASGTCS